MKTKKARGAGYSIHAVKQNPQSGQAARVEYLSHHHLKDGQEVAIYT
jgi:hypothetical protein